MSLKYHFHLLYFFFTFILQCKILVKGGDEMNPPTPFMIILGGGGYVSVRYPVFPSYIVCVVQVEKSISDIPFKLILSWIILITRY